MHKNRAIIWRIKKSRIVTIVTVLSLYSTIATVKPFILTGLASDSLLVFFRKYFDVHTSTTVITCQVLSMLSHTLFRIKFNTSMVFNYGTTAAPRDKIVTILAPKLSEIISIFTSTNISLRISNDVSLTFLA